MFSLLNNLAIQSYKLVLLLGINLAVGTLFGHPSSVTILQYEHPDGIMEEVMLIGYLPDKKDTTRYSPNDLQSLKSFKEVMIEFAHQDDNSFIFALNPNRTDHDSSSMLHQLYSQLCNHTANLRKADHRIPILSDVIHPASLNLIFCDVTDFPLQALHRLQDNTIEDLICILHDITEQNLPFESNSQLNSLDASTLNYLEKLHCKVITGIEHFQKEYIEKTNLPLDTSLLDWLQFHKANPSGFFDYIKKWFSKIELLEMYRDLGDCYVTSFANLNMLCAILERTTRKCIVYITPDQAKDLAKHLSNLGFTETFSSSSRNGSVVSSKVWETLLEEQFCN